MGELVASIAHEINQPLTAIATNANVCSRLLASSTPDLVDLGGAVTDIAKASVRASEVITRIRQLLKRGIPETARMDVNDVIREVVALVQMEAHRKNTRVEADLLGDLPAHPGRSHPDSTSSPESGSERDRCPAKGYRWEERPAHPHQPGGSWGHYDRG